MGANLYIANINVDCLPADNQSHSSFRSVEKYQKYLRKRWNAEVAEEDRVWILGGLCKTPTDSVREFMKTLHGHKQLVSGGVDSVRALKKWRDVFETVTPLYSIIDTGVSGDTDVSMCHYPLESWHNKLDGGVHITGHPQCRAWEAMPLYNRYNACAMSVGFTPRSLLWLQETYGYYQQHYRQLEDFHKLHG